MNIIYEAVVGSHLHGTATLDSDTDRRVVYRDSLFERLSPFKGTQISHKEDDTLYIELSHFARMLAKCNPTAIEIAHGTSPVGDVEFIRALADAAMDTKSYVSRANSMIMELSKGSTPKRLAHAFRVHEHLRRYILTGELDFDARNYPTFQQIIAIKHGDEVVGTSQMPKLLYGIEWHRQNTNRLEQLVVDKYREDV